MNDLINSLREYLNKPPKDLYCQQILGNNTKVKRWANFYENNKSDIALVTMLKLQSFTNGGQFTPDTLKAYKSGLLTIIDFMESCKAEMDKFDVESNTEVDF